jgi:PBSX family phage terminase large subunit
MLRDSTQKTFFDLCERLSIPATFWKAEERARIGKANIYFRSADYPDRLRGPNLGWAWLDEAALMTERAWQVILGRLRVGKPKAWITTTPAGYNWVYRYFVSERRENYAIFRASTRENYFNASGFLDDIIGNYSGEFARQEIDGEFVAFEGLVYSEFRSDLHVVDPLPDLAGYRLVRGIDYGYTNPFVCLWGALDHDGRLYIYDEHYRRKTLIRDHAEAIKARPGEFEWTVADTDAQDNAEMQACGIWTINARKEVIAGIQAVKARMITAGDGKPRLFICSNCVSTLKELGMYRWADSASGRNEKEEPLKENDHNCDALRYMVMQIDNTPLPRVTFIG